MADNGKRGFLVLGVHRSGTSLMAGLLDHSGAIAGLGEDLLPAAADNPTGFFERASFWRLNDRILEAAGGTWDGPPPQAEVEALAKNFKQEIDNTWRVILKEADDAGNAPLVVKDPRMCVTLPVWAPVLLDVLHPILMVRNPLESAYSLRTRNGLPILLGLALWERHLWGALRSLAGRQVTFVSYDDLLDPTIATELLVELGRELSAAQQDRFKPDVSLIEKDLKHEKANLEEFYKIANKRQIFLWEYLQKQQSHKMLVQLSSEIDTPPVFAEELISHCGRLELRESHLNAEGERLHVEGQRIATENLRIHDEWKCISGENSKIRNDVLRLTDEVDQLNVEKQETLLRERVLEADFERLAAEVDNARIRSHRTRENVDKQHRLEILKISEIRKEELSTNEELRRDLAIRTIVLQEIQSNTSEEHERVEGLINEERKLRNSDISIWRAKFEREISKQKQVTRQQRAARREVENKLTAMRQSTSWKVTKPLRAVTRVLRRR